MKIRQHKNTIQSRIFYYLVSLSGWTSTSKDNWLDGFWKEIEQRQAVRHLDYPGMGEYLIKSRKNNVIIDYT